MGTCLVRACLETAFRFGLPTSARLQQPYFRAYATACESRPHTPHLHDLPVWNIMAKRKDANGVVGEDMGIVMSTKKTKVQPIPDHKTSAVIRKEKLVEDINALSMEEFRSRFVDEDMVEYHSDRTSSSSAFNISLVAADWLAPGEYNAAFGLIEETSRADYESSTFGWHPRRKRREMLEPEMKYLLVRRKGIEPTIERRKDVGDMDTSIPGFLSFMVDHDSSPPVPILYVYEIHLAESLRGLGLGNHLMHVVDVLAQSMGLQKVMLTCFLCNEKAHRFYTDHGFIKDVCSPEDRKTRNKTVAVDYVILSKDLKTESLQIQESNGNRI